MTGSATKQSRASYAVLDCFASLAMTVLRALVLALVHPSALLDPRHHVAELGADLFDRVLGEVGTGGLERGLVDLVLQHPVAGELAGLNVVQDPLHLLLGLVGDDARAG